MKFARRKQKPELDLTFDVIYMNGQFYLVPSARRVEDGFVTTLFGESKVASRDTFYSLVTHLHPEKWLPRADIQRINAAAKPSQAELDQGIRFLIIVHDNIRVYQPPKLEGFSGPPVLHLPGPFTPELSDTLWQHFAANV